MTAPGYLGTSENGWHVYDDSHFRAHAVNVEILGQRWWFADHDVATVIGYYIMQFNARVERVVGRVLDDWTRALRAVRGQTKGFSNHASCTAADINATEYPRGRRNMPAVMVREIHQIIAEINALAGGPVLRWGGDYKPPSIVDQMHIEIHPDATRARITRAAEAIRALESKDDDMQLTDQITLTAAAAAAIGSVNGKTGKPFKEGDTVSVQYVMQWSPLVRRLERLVAAQSAQLATLSAAVTAIAANSPTGVKQAFDAGTAQLKAELAKLQITISTGTDS